MLPIFITGMHKSGTTWIAKLLSSHPEVYVNYEAGMLDHEELLSSPERHLQNLYDDESLEYIIFHYLDRWADKPWNHWIDQKNKDLFLRKTFFSIVDNLISQSAGIANPNAKYWVDKTPRTSIAKIKEFFPEAKIIYMMRDGRDRSISLFCHCRRTEPFVIDRVIGYRRMDWDESFRSWRDDIILNEPYFSQLNCQLIRFEDLLCNTNEILSNLFVFLDLQFSDELLDKIISLNTFSVLSGGRNNGVESLDSFYRKGVSGEWKNFEHQDKLINFIKIAGNIAKKYGY